MTLRMAVGLRVVVLLLLIGDMMASVAVAKKPVKPSDDEQQLPVRYQVVLLDGLGGTTTRALSVDSDGTVVGWSTNALGDKVAFIWRTDDSSTQVTDFNAEVATLLPQDGVCTSAVRINNRGQIAGVLVDGNGNTGVFVYTPSREEGELPLATLYCEDLANATDPSGAVERLWVSDLTESGYVLGGFDRPEHGGRGCFVWNPGVKLVIVHGLSFPEGPYETPATLYSPSSMNDDLTIVGKYPSSGGNLAATFWSALPADILDLNQGSETTATTTATAEITAVPEFLAGQTKSAVDSVDINDYAVISAAIDAKGSFRPSQYDLVLGNGWEVLAGNYKVGGFCEAINNSGQICGWLHPKQFQQESDTSFVHDGSCGFWRLDDLTYNGDSPFPLGDMKPQDISDVPDGNESGWGIIVGSKRVEIDGQTQQELGTVLIPEAL